MKIHKRFTYQRQWDHFYAPNYLYLIQALSRDISQYFHSQWDRISYSVLRKSDREEECSLEASFYMLDQEQWNEVKSLLSEIREERVRKRSDELISHIEHSDPQAQA